jgi:iron complex transport system substrate-binding protein
VKRIVSLLPAATEIAAALGLMEHVVGVSHECDFPGAANDRPRVTHCPIHQSKLASHEVDAWVRRALLENGTIYTINEPLLRKLRPDLILTQRLCDVCAVGYETVARLAETLPEPPIVLNLEPSSLGDILQNIRQVAEVCAVSERADTVTQQLRSRVETVRRRAAQIDQRPSCFLMEWVDPPFCAGHWGPELVEIAGGFDPLGQKHQKSVQVEWDQVLKAQPEVIVLALCGYDVARAEGDLKLLRTYPHFETLPAAQANRIHAVNANALFARPGPRIVDSLELLAGILHPKTFPEFRRYSPSQMRSSTAL